MNGPPDNAGFMYAAYVLALFVYGGYAAVLLRRRARVRRVLDAHERAHERPGGPA